MELVQRSREEAKSQKRIDAQQSAGLAGRPTAPTIGILILALIAAIYTLYVGKEVALPLAMALILKLLFQPIMHVLSDRLRLPQIVSALLVIVCLFFAIFAGAFALSGPATNWLQKGPDVIPALKEKLAVLRQPIDYLQKGFQQIEEEVSTTRDGADTPTVTVKQSAAVGSWLAIGTATVLARTVATLIILFFLLASGDRLMRGFIEVLPRFADKRQAVEIAAEIQRQIGGYLLTITAMNIVVGLTTGLVMWECGLGDPLLWGSGAFLLNFVPILGPLVGVGILLLAGIVALDWPWHALLPASLYLSIHIAEGEAITPMLLSKRFTLNPVLVILSLFFWYALWGVPGALLAVPILAIVKILCDRIDPLEPIGHIIGA
ncbi:MAG: AI-2E family transporter [Terriglobales bacterium]|jgi:predicted PurR-regulated permease PerM